MVGNDKEKLKVLNSLAETDYKSGERIHFSKHVDTIYGNGQVAKECLHVSSIKSHFEIENEYFIQQAEKQLPVLIRFEGDGNGRNEIIKQTLPQSPLYVLTLLFENDYGEMRPYTITENIDWIESERLRLGVKL